MATPKNLQLWNSSIQLQPPALIDTNNYDIRSAVKAGGQYMHDESLTEWQDWAQKALHVQNDPLLLLMFHDINIKFIMDTVRSHIEMNTGEVSKGPEKQHLIESLLLTYQKFTSFKRKNLRSLFLRVNDYIVNNIVNKMIKERSMYLYYYNDKHSQPVPMQHPKNVHSGGVRALKGRKAFIL